MHALKAMITLFAAISTGVPALAAPGPAVTAVQDADASLALAMTSRPRQYALHSGLPHPHTAGRPRQTAASHTLIIKGNREMTLRTLGLAIAAAWLVPLSAQAQSRSLEDLLADPREAAERQKLDSAAEVCASASGKPRNVLAEAAPRAGFDFNAAQGWWQWSSDGLGPTVILFHQPTRCRVVIGQIRLSREKVADAVFAWGRANGFSVVRHTAAGESDASIVSGNGPAGVRLNLWPDSSTLKLDFER